MRFSFALAAVAALTLQIGAASAEQKPAPAVGEAPKPLAAPTAEGRVGAFVRAQAMLDRNTPFGAKVQFVETPFAAPATPIVSPDGSSTTLADHKGSVVVAVFWATWCHVCAVEMPQMDLFAATLGDAPIKVLPVSLDGGPQAAAKIEAFYKKRGIKTLPVMIDQDQLNAGLIGIRATPTALVIDVEGNFVAAIEGRGHWETPEARKFLEILAQDAVKG